MKNNLTYKSLSEQNKKAFKIFFILLQFLTISALLLAHYRDLNFVASESVTDISKVDLNVIGWMITNYFTAFVGWMFKKTTSFIKTTFRKLQPQTV